MIKSNYEKALILLNDIEKLEAHIAQVKPQPNHVKEVYLCVCSFENYGKEKKITRVNESGIDDEDIERIVYNFSKHYNQSLKKALAKKQAEFKNL
jgi:hypothetical protein